MTLGFTTSLPVVSLRRQPSQHFAPSDRHHHHGLPSRQARLPAQATLLTDLVFKTAMEVFTSTPRSSSTSTNEPQRRFPQSASQLPEELVYMVHTFARMPRSKDFSRNLTKLMICVVIDLIGSGGLGLPLLGDMLDIIVAPLSATALHALFAMPSISALGFVEEVLPGTDFIPTATLAWLASNLGYLPASTSSSS